MAQLSLSERLLGRGLGLPIRPAPGDRALPWTEGRHAVRQSIQIILETQPGERIMRPDFGCGLWQYIMKPNTATTRELIRRAVERSLITWEPRVTLDEVRVDPSDADPSLVVVSIAYTHRVDRTSESAVYQVALEG